MNELIQITAAWVITGITLLFIYLTIGVIGDKFRECTRLKERVKLLEEREEYLKKSLEKSREECERLNKEFEQMTDYCADLETASNAKFNEISAAVQNYFKWMKQQQDKYN